MKKILIFVLLGVTIFTCKENSKQTEGTLEEIEKEVNSKVEWITLFDGTSLEKWRGYLTDEMHPEWTIEDGTLVFNPGENGGKNIITKDTFTNFELSIEWKISEGGNSGIFFGVFEDPSLNEAYQSGPEIQVLDNERHPDAKANPKYHQAGALYDLVQPEKDVCHPAGEWNLCVLKVNHKTNEGEVKLNGTKIVSFPLHGEAWDTMVENSKFKGWEHFGKHHTGHIGLQDHGDKVWFRNIKIKKL
ncbi:DUF1080 domain-containing protein [Litoribaculum gwangyangense]|uniref:DUF1080 domain-containing protein n=1 Tax=Litoribaculum gwangyangense TaxID=1130722 RepID=A0ABP9BSC2_9FLAO